MIALNAGIEHFTVFQPAENVRAVDMKCIYQEHEVHGVAIAVGKWLSKIKASEAVDIVARNIHNPSS
jgi:hypothetical protein